LIDEEVIGRMDDEGKEVALAGFGEIRVGIF
jgi:hypothetical protein